MTADDERPALIRWLARELEWCQDHLRLIADERNANADIVVMHGTLDALLGVPIVQPPWRDWLPADLTELEDAKAVAACPACEVVRLHGAATLDSAINLARTPR